jgi:hypothetical protein
VDARLGHACYLLAWIAVDIAEQARVGNMPFVSLAPMLMARPLAPDR